MAALLTQILSDAATTDLLAPVASFLTPIGHHGNLLILSPGSYRFADFFKFGLPLTIILSLLTCYLSLMFWKV